MVIGLTHTGNPQKHQNYINWLKGQDDIQVIELSAENENPGEIAKCDALVLSGGIDVHPRFYHSTELNYLNSPEVFNEKRDEFEITAFKFAQDHHLPVLGICRGMQLINVIHNGTLIQDLEKNNLNAIHKGEPDKSHAITIDENTILSQVIPEKSVIVNSAHHQAIDKVGDGLLVNAKSPEGIVEGLERKQNNGPFLLAVQWHPERMFRFGLEDSSPSLALRNRFLKEVKLSIEGKK